MFTQIVFSLKSGADTLRYSIHRIKVNSFVMVAVWEFQESGGCPVLQIRV